MKKLKHIIILLAALLLTPQSVSAAQLLIPVGEVIGMELKDNSVTVAAFDPGKNNPAQKGGMEKGDRILTIDKKKITCVADVRTALEKSDGTVDATVLRQGKEKHLHLTPAITTQGPRLGIYLKEGVTGVGTVTFYDPQTGDYGALGHGVNQSDGSLLSMKEGNAYDANIVSVRKGKIGTPGQLLGSLNPEKPLGQLDKNTPQGVFGKVQNRWRGEALPVAAACDVHTGAATIRSCIGNQVQEYSVEILKIYPAGNHADRNLLLHITDPALLDTTGGIVQGMSGSPIIQDGKLIGAVTHVLVNDPTTGYGIFIENMLDAAA